jgi:hypothetical protein
MAAQTNWEMEYRRMNSSLSSSTGHMMIATNPTTNATAPLSSSSSSDQREGELKQAPLRDVSKRGLLGTGSRHYKSSNSSSSSSSSSNSNSSTYGRGDSSSDSRMIPVASAVVVDREVSTYIYIYTCMHTFASILECI